MDINVTKALREHCVKNFELAADASDDDVKKLARTKFIDGELTGETLKELTVSSTQKAAGELGDSIATKIVGSLTPLFEKLTEAVGSKAAPEAGTKETPDEKPKTEKAKTEPGDDAEYEKAYSRFKEELEESFAKKLEGIEKKIGARGGDSNEVLDTDVTSYDVLSKGIGVEKDPVRLRVKSVIERFDNTKTAATYTRKQWREAFRDQPITHNGQEVNKPTDLRKAMAAAWFKLMAVPEAMTQHDRDLCMHVLHNEPFKWVSEDSADARMLKDFERQSVWNAHAMGLDFRGQKAVTLINDSTSGGQYATPEFFDMDMILLPILGGELGPLCNIVDVPRGSAAQNFQVENPTFTADNTEGSGSALTLFTTDSYIANHDTTFFKAAGAMEVGRNFLEDAVPGMANQIVNAYGRKAQEWVDEQVAAGDGSTEPQGIIVASGTADITPTTPSSGTRTVTDALNLLFGVSKAFRNNYPSSQAAFIMTDTSYKRFRQIATGVTGDTRLLFGMKVEDYMLLDHPVAIVETGLTDSDIAFAQCGGYRLYRRQGIRFTREDRGKTLILASSVLIHADMRYGGQLDRGGYAAVMDAAA